MTQTQTITTGYNSPSVALRLVIWQNVWNWTLEESGTTRIHVTSSAGLSGKTLCGRPFPAAKGYPVAVRYCKRCEAAAKRLGHEAQEIRKFNYVRSQEV